MHLFGVDFVAFRIHSSPLWKKRLYTSSNLQPHNLLCYGVNKVHSAPNRGVCSHVFHIVSLQLVKSCSCPFNMFTGSQAGSQMILQIKYLHFFPCRILYTCTHTVDWAYACSDSYSWKKPSVFFYRTTSVWHLLINILISEAVRLVV